MSKLFNALWSQYLKVHRAQMRAFIERPVESQAKELRKIVRTSASTEWGLRYGFDRYSKTSDWRSFLPVQDYETVKADIHRMMAGEKNVLWPGRVKYFAKSSGTTADKSKYIPITDTNHRHCHSRGGWRLVTSIFDNVPRPRIFEGKCILLAGSSAAAPGGSPGTLAGDVSAIIYQRLNPLVLKVLYPGMDTALMADFEQKLDRIAEGAADIDVRLIAGTPTWMLVLLRKILDHTGKRHILDVWPQMQVYVHGAVSFVPYRAPFREFFPSDDFYYLESYNASEGYFAVQDDITRDDMLLLLDNGVFYEFIPMEYWESENPKTLFLEEVEAGKNYAVVITTNSGLFRYKIGDTVQFTSLNPFRIVITGRTRQFINVFGEEVMVANTDAALSEACQVFGVTVADYTVAPIFQSSTGKGGHEWLVEFKTAPRDPSAFAAALDEALKKVNSDYEAKRFGDLALQPLKLNVAPSGTFYQWLKEKNKIGAQQKVPRLSNQRTLLEELLLLAGARP
ncbi:MAG: GH3 auxin-responsive promoter family protein [Saprospiraceae bacterium]|jgi:hypothetical protein|nr:GH3 auxin-responsive promoter family protein [Saprospiraceae bacterium]MBP9208955.1 GH3 auxin-responsive promoter family protein [Saprospiraceae bacterium]MBV6472809.1 hypothetical protein [Saprospiraceae bacterium]